MIIIFFSILILIIGLILFIIYIKPFQPVEPDIPYITDIPIIMKDSSEDIIAYSTRLANLKETCNFMLINYFTTDLSEKSF